MKKGLFLLLAFVLIISCSKDDSSNSINQNGGEIFRSQVVTVNLPNTSLSENEYQGTLDGIAITLSKSEDNKLLFLVPSSTTIGLHDLVIPSVNNATIHFDVKETVLTDTPEVTLAPLFINLATFVQTLAASSSPEALNMQNNFDSFNNYYNNASTDDKTQIAIAYKANKIIIDEIILNDYSNVSGRLTLSDKNILLKFSLAVLSINIGTQLAISGFHPGIRALGVIIAGVATTSAIDFYVQFIEKEVRELGLNIHSISGINDKNTLNSVISIQDNVASTFPINTLKRKLNSSDSSLAQPLAISFFKSKVAYNYVISKVNIAIQFLNNNNSFFTFGLLQLAQLPATTTSVLRSTNQEIFDNIQFTVSDPNLTLVSASLQSDGQINMKIKIIGTPSSLPVESFLNYSYTDEFSAFSGKLPIEVNDYQPPVEVTIGSQIWTGINLDVSTYRNGDPIPEVQNGTQWENLTTGAWCYYQNSSVYGTVYGKLYNWYAVNDPRGLAPTGWHIPNNAEWSSLTTYLGGNLATGGAGGKMKEAGTSHWAYPNNDASNSSGFTALPGGTRNHYQGALFNAVTTGGCFWSATENDSDYVSSCLLKSNNGFILFTAQNSKKYGLSVRCIKN